MSSSEIPSVDVLKAITPENAAQGDETLLYLNLRPALEAYRQFEPARTARVWHSEEDSLEELSAVRQLASEYLLEDAEKINTALTPESYDMWADRFTQASIELYGQPEKTEATTLLLEEYQSLLKVRGNTDISQPHMSFLLETYASLLVDSASAVDTHAAEQQASKEAVAISMYGEALRGKYQPIFDLVDTSKQDYSATDLEGLFKNALEWLKANVAQTWGDWQAPLSKGTSLSVSASTRTIKIAEGREPTTPTGALELLAHELLVHALRAQNGFETGDGKLGTGLPGYLDAEEGLGVLSEKAIVGELSEKIVDRYLDIALALGVIDGVQRNRQQLYQISYARKLIHNQLRSGSVETAAIARSTWRHIDRIYRGGRGDDFGGRQAIFTKDIAYYVGYKQMAAYISQAIDAGKKPVDLVAYLSSSKFDPTNSNHVAYIKERGIVEPR